jgi:transposase
MKTMPKTCAEEKMRWIKPIINHELTIEQIAKISPFSERCIKYWLANYKKHGYSGLVNQSTRPKSNPKETPIRVKERIIELRHEENVCALKLHWKLKKEGINIGHRVIGKILKQEGLVRKYRSRKKHPNKKVIWQNGEMVEIDIKYVPDAIEGKKYYQFTAIDCSSRWRYLKIYDDMSNYSAVCFLRQVREVAPFQIMAIKTDNGSCFTNRYTGYKKSADPTNPKIHIFDLTCANMSMEHYLIDPGKPAQNGHVEKSHGADQTKVYDQFKFQTVEELKYRIRLWNMYYNDLEHCALNGLTPNQALNQRVQYVCS